MEILAEAPRTSAPSQPAAPRRGLWLTRRKILGLVVLVALGLFLVEAIRVLGGANFHTVLPGRVYRSAQPSPEKLEGLVRDYGIKSVVNLRGIGTPSPWYVDACRAAQRLGLSQEDICLSSGRLPSVQEIRRLLEVLERTEYPLVLHCWRGADRTGLVSAMILLLQPDTSLSEARRQLGVRYGHVALGRPAYLDEFLELYESWLHEKGNAHTPELLRRWVMHEYQGGPYCCRWERLECTSGPPRLGDPIVYQVRVRNTSTRTWRLSPHSVGGVHVAFRVLREAREVANGRCGMRAGEVAPGETFDVTVILPPICEAGRYWVFVDLIDPQHGWFSQANAEPATEEFDVRE